MFWNLSEKIKSKFRPADLLSAIDLHAGDIAIDCGANVGNITARMSVSGATIYAFEPNPYAFQVLSRRFSKNQMCIVITKAY